MFTGALVKDLNGREEIDGPDLGSDFAQRKVFGQPGVRFIIVKAKKSGTPARQQGLAGVIKDLLLPAMQPGPGDEGKGEDKTHGGDIRRGYKLRKALRKYAVRAQSIQHGSGKDRQTHPCRPDCLLPVEAELAAASHDLHPEETGNPDRSKDAKEQPRGVHPLAENGHGVARKIKPQVPTRSMIGKRPEDQARQIRRVRQESHADVEKKQHNKRCEQCIATCQGRVLSLQPMQMTSIQFDYAKMTITQLMLAAKAGELTIKLGGVTALLEELFPGNDTGLQRNEIRDYLSFFRTSRTRLLQARPRGTPQSDLDNFLRGGHGV